MKENSKMKKIMPFIIIIGVIIIPLLYSYFYLGAFWDPYSKLDTVPVAIVNEDKGAIIHNEERNIGSEMCDKLKEDATLKFIFTDAKTAKEGTEDSEYYATITIPSNFTECIATASETEKQIATITYTPNEKRNYLASQILSNAVTRIEKSMRASINKEIVTRLSDNLKSSPDQLTTLSKGLTKLYDGSSNLQGGTSDLKNGALDLQSGALKLADGSNVLKNGTSELKDGTNALLEGTDKLVNGSSDLKTGAKTFSNKMSQFKTGVDGAVSGSKELSTNMKALDTGIQALLDGAITLESSTKNINDLKTGAESLAKGASEFNIGFVTYTTGVDTLIANVKQTTQVLSAYATKTGDKTISTLVSQLTSQDNLNSIAKLSAASTSLKTASSQIVAGATALEKGTTNIGDLKTAISQMKTGLKTAKSGSAALSTGATSLTTGLNKLSSASTKLSDASKQISDGAGTLNGGLLSLQTGISKIDVGATSLSDGATKLSTGTNQLADGTKTLVDGTSDLDDGAKQIKDGLKTAKDGVDESISDVNRQLEALNGLDEFAANPVDIETKPYATVPNYGTAFGPYFMSLSLWVGGLMIFFGIYFDPDGKFKLLSRESNNKRLRSLAFLLIGFIQAIVLDLVLIFALGMQINNKLMFFVSTILVSMVFISIIQLLILFLRNIGKFLSLFFLIIQLTSCGGTFPIETVPNFFHVLYPFMPMTYSVGLFKESISGVGGNSLAWKNAGVLIVILVITMAITLIFSKANQLKVSKLEKAID